MKKRLIESLLLPIIVRTCTGRAERYRKEAFTISTSWTAVVVKFLWSSALGSDLGWNFRTLLENYAERGPVCSLYWCEKAEHHEIDPLAGFPVWQDELCHESCRLRK